MAAIRAEQEEQTRILLAQQSALDVVISSIQDLRIMGKLDPDTEESQEATPALDSQPGEGGDVEMGQASQGESGEIQETAEGVIEASNAVSSPSRQLNPSAAPFVPSSTPRLEAPQSNAPTPIPSSEPKREDQEEGETDDIEMGELAEEPEEKPQPPKKKVREELEEGEASDSDLGSELTDISDD